MIMRFRHPALPFPTDEEIEGAKLVAQRERLYQSCDPVHEHHDCIRAAFAWLDAQQTIAKRPRSWHPVKSLVEGWAKRYVSADDVVVAALLHPHIKGHYPDFHISSRLTLPDLARLDGLQVGMHSYKTSPEMYYSIEDPL